MLALVVRLCCVGFVNTIGVVTGARRQERSFFYWAHVTRCHLKMETDSSVQAIVF
jgi:hypothetical protein